MATAGNMEKKFSKLLPYFKYDEYLSEYHMEGRRHNGLPAYVLSVFKACVEHVAGSIHIFRIKGIPFLYEINQLNLR